MTLSFGRTYLAIPGPSVMPDRVLNAMHCAAPNIYEGPLVETAERVASGLKRVARTEGHVAIYIANGHGAWEAAASNVTAPGDRVLVLATGRFGHGWAEVFRRLGVTCDVLDFGLHDTVDLAAVQAALTVDGNYKAVAMVHVDTATSVRNDVAEVRALLDRLGHDALFMVDCIASLAVDRFEMDAWGVDVMVAASQKGLMTPPGLGFVFFNDKAAARQAETASFYWDWRKRAAPEMLYEYFAGTAPTHHLLGLAEALSMIEEEGGVEAVWTRHEHLAQAVWAAVDTWAEAGDLKINIADRALRAHAVTSLRLPGDGGTRLRQWCEGKAGVTLGIGLGMAELGSAEADAFFRLGHMGHVNAPMIMGLLGVLEAGLSALDIPHGDGALAAAAKVISGA